MATKKSACKVCRTIAVLNREGLCLGCERYRERAIADRAILLAAEEERGVEQARRKAFGRVFYLPYREDEDRLKKWGW